MIGMGLSVTLLSGLFHTHIYTVSSLFLGLVAASVPVVAIEEKATLKAFRPWHILLFLAGAGAVVGLSFLHIPISVTNLNPLSAIYILLGGALAISAMVLPGISGSTLLLAFGLYVPVISGLKQILSFDFSPFLFLFLFGIGVLGGIFGSFRGIHHLLKHHRAATVSVILGLMVGSLFAVVMGPTTLEQPLSPLNPGNFATGAFLIGILLVAGFAAGKMLLQKHKLRENADQSA